jgi:putative ABC transport system ATP-binding protein
VLVVVPGRNRDAARSPHAQGLHGDGSTGPSCRAPLLYKQGSSHRPHGWRHPHSRVPSPAVSTAVLSVSGLTKVYRMGEVEVHALRGVDMDLVEGELMVLLGASGSGKSTLLNIMGGLDTPTDGRVRYRDWELTRADERMLTEYRRHHVGFVFQFYNLIPSLTARENIALVTEISRRPMTPEDALALVGLEDRMDHFPSQLSGGEQQRVAIARAVAKQPDVLLCDEPTGALDFKTGIRVLSVIESVNRELGTTTAVITHNASVGQMADRVVTLADGRIHEEIRNETKLAPEALRW